MAAVSCDADKPWNMRASSIHRYLPEEYRARVNAFSQATTCIAGSLGALHFGAMGEFLDYRLTMTIIALVSMIACWLTTGRNKKALDKIYLYQSSDTE